jgi:hypothetical protein
MAIPPSNEIRALLDAPNFAHLRHPDVRWFTAERPHLGGS